MSDKQFINKIVNNALMICSVDDSKFLSDKIESMLLLILIDRPTKILGVDEYIGNNFDVIEYGNINFSKALVQSEQFVEFMYRFRNRLRGIYTLCQLDKLRYILEQIYFREDITESLREKAFVVESLLEEILGNEERKVLGDINDNPVDFLKSNPKTFFRFLKKMSAVKYYDCIMDNDFVDTIYELIEDGYEFTYEQLNECIKILGTGIVIYQSNIFESECEIDEETGLALSLRSYKSQKDIMNFDFDFCSTVYHKVDELLEKSKRKIK